MRILVKYPTRQRPKIFLTRLREWASAATDLSEVTFLVSIDEDDASMTDDVIAVANKIARDVRIFRGPNKSKIAACNADVDKIPNWDVMLLISDDMFCRRSGWDAMIRRQMYLRFPDTDGCLWFHDGTRQKEICTLSCIGRKYYDRFGYVYHPSYFSFFCDNEFTEVAKMAGKIEFIDQPISTHEHPAWNGGMKRDDLYAKNNRYWKQDEANYHARKANGFAS